MRRISFVLSAAIIMICLSTPLSAKEDKRLYRRGMKAAEAGDPDFAFTYFDELLKKVPDSEYAADALFATGEYYFSIADYYDAKEAFTQSIQGNEDKEAAIFAYAYLMVIAEKEGDQDRTLHYKKKVVTFKQLSLMFRESKEITFPSPFARKYKAVFFIDKVEIYIDEELFKTIAF